jgi:hypothetical protein
MSFVDLNSMAHTSWYHYHLVRQHILCHVAHLILLWSLPEGIYGFMKEQQIVFSGLAILALMEPGTFHVKDLDVYIPIGTLANVDVFLLEHTLYVKLPGTQKAIQGTHQDYTQAEAGTTLSACVELSLTSC